MVGAEQDSVLLAAVSWAGKGIVGVGNVVVGVENVVVGVENVVVGVEPRVG